MPKIWSYNKEGCVCLCYWRLVDLMHCCLYLPIKLHKVFVVVFRSHISCAKAGAAGTSQDGWLLVQIKPTWSAIHQQLPLKLICTGWKSLSHIKSSWEGVKEWSGGKGCRIVLLWCLWRRRYRKVRLSIPTLQKRGRRQTDGMETSFPFASLELLHLRAALKDGRPDREKSRDSGAVAVSTWMMSGSIVLVCSRAGLLCLAQVVRGDGPLQNRTEDYSVFCIPLEQEEMVAQNQEDFLVHNKLVCSHRSLCGKRKAGGVLGGNVEIKL